MVDLRSTGDIGMGKYLELTNPRPFEAARWMDQHELPLHKLLEVLPPRLFSQRRKGGRTARLIIVVSVPLPSYLVREREITRPLQSLRGCGSYLLLGVLI